MFMGTPSEKPKIDQQHSEGGGGAPSFDVRSNGPNSCQNDSGFTGEEEQDVGGKKTMKHALSASARLPVTIFSFFAMGCALYGIIEYVEWRGYSIIRAVFISGR